MAYGFHPGKDKNSDLVVAFGMFVPYADFVQASVDESISSGTEQMDIYSLLSKKSRLYVLSAGFGYSVSEYNRKRDYPLWIIQ